MRIGLIGLGKAGLRHADACLKADEVELVGAADPAPAASAAADRLRTPHYAAWQELVARERPQAVIVSLPHGLLSEVGAECARRGLHVLLEKPMGVSLDEADAVIEAARQGGGRLMVNFVHRFRAEFRTAKRTVEAGVIGRPTLILDAMTAGRGELPGWVWDRRLAGGGMLMYNGVHSLDRLAWLAGSPIARIGGVTATASYPTELEDNAVASVVFRNGVLGALVLHKSDAPTTLGDWRTTIWGTRGAIRVLTGGQLEVASDKERASMAVEADDRFYGALREFVDAIQANRDPVPGGEDGRAALAATLALYAAASTGVMQEVSPS